MPDRLALIIANSDFDDPKLCRLKTPTRDAEALAEVLEDPDIGDFDVTLLIDQPEGRVRRQIARLYYRRKRSDLLLLYYSGHGIRDAHGDLYLATKDTEMDLVGATALEATYVRTQIDRSNSQRNVVVLDCCHSGAFAGRKSGLGDSVGTKDAFAGSGYGRVILTASDAVQMAWEGGEWLGEGQPSVFTHFLVEGLRNGAADLDRDGKITLDELYDYVYEQVLTSGHAKQTPHKWAQKVQGQIVIARSPSAPAAESVLPGWIVEALASSAYSARLAAVGELAQLSRGEDRSLVAAARAELERLSQEDEDPVVRSAAAGALGIVFASPQKQEEVKPAPTPREPDQPQAREPDRMVWERDGKEMVRVPAGKFLYRYEKETRELPEFWIDKTPVTNAEYAHFVAETAHMPPEHWEGKNPPEDIADHPVVFVNWHDAVAYAEWAGKRLPTEEEWEKAARGTDGRKYPWGDKKPTRDLCNFGSNEGGTTPVGKYSPQGDSPYGCVDMAGNVWEWTSSDYDDETKVLRGGAWNNHPENLRGATRGRNRPGSRVNYLGFRCARGSE